ncbi:MAG: glycosyltransferase family 4 protein [Candidatus Heimdallarchaeaceae archaeon]
MGRICIISQYFTPDVAGSVTRLKNLLKVLSKLNHEIILITSVPHYPYGDIPEKYRTKWRFKEKYGDNINLIRLRMLNIPHNNFLNRLVNYIFFCFMSLTAIPSIKKIDCIWVTSPNFFGNIAGIIYKIFKRVPLILNVDDFWPDVVESLGILQSKLLIKFADIFNIFAYNYCDYITPISSMIRKRIVQKYNISPKKIHVIEVGFEVYEFEQNLKKINNKDYSLTNKNNNYFTIIYSGILGPAYDFDLILESQKIIEKKGYDTNLLIHGCGELKDYITNKIKKLKLKNAEIIGKHFQFNEYILFLLSGSLFLLPMKKGIFTETAIPSKLFTYLMLNKPIIATNGGDVEIILKNAKAGITVEYDPQILANEIIHFIENKDFYESYCGKGIDYLKENYSLKCIQRKVIQLLEKIL